jgi:hypothetical protein
VDLQAGVRRERSLNRSPQVLLRCVCFVHQLLRPAY